LAHGRGFRCLNILRPLREQLARIACGLAGISEELREIARGIRPAILSKGGLGPALTTLAPPAARLPR